MKRRSLPDFRTEISFRSTRRRGVRDVDEFSIFADERPSFLGIFFFFPSKGFDLTVILSSVELEGGGGRGQANKGQGQKGKGKETENQPFEVLGLFTLIRQPPNS